MLAFFGAMFGLDLNYLKSTMIPLNCNSEWTWKASEKRVFGGEFANYLFGCTFGCKPKK